MNNNLPKDEELEVEPSAPGIAGSETKPHANAGIDNERSGNGGTNVDAVLDRNDSRKGQSAVGSSSGSLSADEVFAFACHLASDTSGHETIYNRKTVGQAKADYFRMVRDPFPDVKYTEIRARKVGPAQSSKDFIRNAIYRGMPDVRCGQRIKACGCNGVIVGHNSSANFDVLFTDGRFNGMTLNVHPSEVTCV